MRTMISALRTARRSDDGFTLVELVLAVAILATVSVALTGIVISYLKVSGSTEARLGESTDEQFVSAYWQTDVASLGRRIYDPSNATNPVSTEQSVWLSPAGGCGRAFGDVVVRFEWNEFPVGTDENQAWQGSDQSVAYVTAPTSTGELVLRRVRCYPARTATQIVARHLTSKPEVTCAPTCGPALPDSVSIKLIGKDVSDGDKGTGYETTLTADRRQQG